MKYTFINENKKEQTINIPDEFIRKNRAALGISTQEAILLYLSDEGYITNEVVEALTQKAKEGKVGVRGAANKKRKAPVRKEDPTKRAIIDSIYQFIMSGEIDKKLMFDREIAPVEITNPERIISFSIGKDKYELTLSKKRPPKE